MRLKNLPCGFCAAFLAPTLLANASAFAVGSTPRVIEIVADNRGRVDIQMNCPLRPQTVNQQTAVVSTVGPDGVFGTSDDVTATSQVAYRSLENRIEIRADVPADTPYRVFLDSSVIVSVANASLDGEFNGPDEISGDGSPGGDYIAFTRFPEQTVARFRINERPIDVRLFPFATPITVANFRAYADAGEWDDTIIHRSVEDFIFQGGGFEASSSFGDVDTLPPIQNEPGISNLRGTVAMAKLGGDPDSATSQWFFNLTDNSENLDNQNGGFTVFGEVTDATGLSNMDTIASFPTVNASANSGAFTDVPVMSVSDFEDNNNFLVLANAIVVQRVSILVDVADTPALNFTGDNGVIETPPAGDAQVMVFDTAGGAVPEGAVTVSYYDRGDSVRTVVLNNDMPSDMDIVISIRSSQPVLSILDRRVNASPIMLIQSNASINSLSLSSGIAGVNINGVTLPDGTVLPNDIDGDGSGADNTAIFIQNGGSIPTMFIRGDVNGDVVVPGGTRSINITGDVSDSTFVMGDFPGPGGFSLLFGRGNNVRVDTADDIRLLRAKEITSSGDGPQSRLVASSIASITTLGDRVLGLDGDFEADIVTTGMSEDSSPRALGTVFVAGSMRDAMVDLDRSMFGSFIIRGDISDSTVTVAGDLNGTVSAGLIEDSTFTVDGGLLGITAKEIIRSAVTADTLRTIRTLGDRIRGLDGDLDMDITVPNTAGMRFPLSSLFVAGMMRDSTVDITGSSISVFIRGNAENISYTQTGDLFTWSSRRARDVTLAITGDMRTVSAVDWNGGSITSANLLTVTMLGDIREGVPGDFRADLTADRVSTFTTRNGGTVEGFLIMLRVNAITVAGDAVNSTFQFNDVSITNIPLVVCNSLRISGIMDTTNVRTRGAITNIYNTGMVNSAIYCGYASVATTGFPTSADQINPLANIGRVTVGRLDDRSVFQDSLIIGAQIGGVFIPEPSSFGAESGVSYSSLTGSIEILEGSSRTTIRQTDGSLALDNLQIRSFHQEPVNP